MAGGGDGRSPAARANSHLDRLSRLRRRLSGCRWARALQGAGRSRALPLCRRPHLRPGHRRRRPGRPLLAARRLEGVGGAGPRARRRAGRPLDARQRSGRARKRRGPAGRMSPFDGPAPRWFTIAPHRPFLTDLASRLVEALPDPGELAEAIVLVPSRRAARGLAAAFLETGGGRARLLPQIRALGDLEDGEPPFEPGDVALDLAPAISPWRRQIGRASCRERV